MTPEQVVPIPPYLDWKFWSAAVALAALVLSQLPPIHLWFRRAKVDLEVLSQMLINHRVGNPFVQVHLIVANVGGRAVKVKNISLDIRRGEESIIKLFARGYLQSPSDQVAVLFTRLKLEPGDDWGHIVNFFNYLPRQEARQLKQAEANLKSDIFAKRAELENKDINVAAAPELLKPFESMVDAKFPWEPGEYTVTVSVEAEPKRAATSRAFRMTIFESDAADLRAYIEDYRYGFGLFLAASNQPGVIVPLSPA